MEIRLIDYLVIDSLEPIELVESVHSVWLYLQPIEKKQLRKLKQQNWMMPKLKRWTILPVRVVEKSAFVVERDQAFVQQVFEVEHEQFDKWFDHFPLILVPVRVQFVAWTEIEVLARFDLKIWRRKNKNKIWLIWFSLNEKKFNHKIKRPAWWNDNNATWNLLPTKTKMILFGSNDTKWWRNTWPVTIKTECRIRFMSFFVEKKNSEF